MGKNWRAGRSKKVAVTQNNTIPGRVAALYRVLGTWDAVARKIGISRGMAWRVANGYQPKDNTIRAALGLPVSVSVDSCPKCGKAHLVKRPRHPKTFDENSREYDKWLLTHAAELAERVVWAEGKR